MSDNTRLTRASNDANLLSVMNMLVCPISKEPLELIRLDKVEQKLGVNLVPTSGKQGFATPGGSPEKVLFDKNRNSAFPVVDGIPILLAPEMLVPQGKNLSFDLYSPPYREVYADMAVYNSAAMQESYCIADTESGAAVQPALEASPVDVGNFPAPKDVWLDATYDCVAQWGAYCHIAPLLNGRVLQLGGKGIHAVKFLLAGAKEAWLLTPMFGEALCAQKLAEWAGVHDRLHCCIGVAEEIPFASNTFDGIYSGACMHHVALDLAMPECFRILKHGGRFASVDPWCAPFYRIGIRIFGKREEGVHCRPLDKERVQAFWRSFPDGRIVHHGAFTRYPLLALSKLGFRHQISSVWNLTKIDDRLCSLFPKLRSLGSSVSLVGTKPSH